MSSCGRRAILPALCALISCGPPVAKAADPEVRFDFETGDLQGWMVVEGRFDELVCDREKFHNQPTVAYNKQGRYFLSTLEMSNGRPNDRMTGVVISPVFRLGGPQISLLVGGGAHSDTYVALCMKDGEEILRASGANTEVMRRVTWDATSVVGRRVFIKVVDHNRGSWGHVTLDDVRARGTIDPPATARLQRRYSQIAQALAARREARRARRLRQFMSEDRLFKRGRPRIYRGDHLGAISLPVGGIGAGTIEINGEAVRHVWHIFNNFDLAFIPDTFFAVRVKAAGAEPVVRALQTRPVGPFVAMESLTFRGEYPFGWFDFHDPGVSINVTLETLNPLVPLEVRDSAIPCAIYNLTAENRTDETAEVAFLAAQQNAVGFTGNADIEGRSCPAYGANSNRIRRERGATILHMTAQIEENAPGFGDMALVALVEDASATARWDDMSALLSDFASDGEISGPESAGPSPHGETLDGALAVRFRLKPGHKRTVPFILTWHFPNARHGNGKWGGEGNMYANWWASALEVSRETSDRLDELTRLTRLYHDTLYESNLPRWLLDRISSSLVVLRSTTTFWCKDGYFGGWEGCHRDSGCCPGNCAHVWHYAQAHARLFPAIGKTMREQEWAHQRADGMIPFRQSGSGAALDGQCGNVLSAYREHLMSADGEWLERHWPSITKAMDFVISTWDEDEDGVLAGPQHNTLDGEAGGSSSWLGTMYLAALASAERMAEIQGESQPARRYRRIRESGSKKQNETLWNGEYYIQIPDPEPREDYATGCHIDQVLGQWWAHQLDLGWLYPSDRVRTALRSLFKYNFRADFHGITQSPRKFVDDHDAGMQMITWPKGGRPTPPHVMRYADEVMSGFEYSAAAAMVQAGLLKEGFAVVRAAADRYDGRLRTGLSDAAWGYSGNPFCDDECGKFYARPMSIWSMLLACQGFIYDGPAGVIGFRPVWKPENHRSFFGAAEGWGLFVQDRDGRKQTDRIEVRYGRLELASLVFELPDGVEPSNVVVEVAGERVLASHVVRDGRLLITLPARMTVSEGEAVAVSAQ